MKRIFLVLSSMICINLYAQTDTEMMQNLRDDFNYGEFNPGANHIYYGVKQKPGVVKGDVYLDPQWHKAAVVFYPDIVKRYDPKAPDSIAGYMVRVDLSSQVVEFQLKEGVKAVDISSVRKIYYEAESGRLVKLVNAREFNDGNANSQGLLELLSAGKLCVVKATTLKIKEPTYNVALDVGEKDAKIYKKGIYYYMDKKGNALVEFKPTKKKLLLLMGSKADKVEKYIDNNQLNLKDDVDLQRALVYYNGL